MYNVVDHIKLEDLDQVRKANNYKYIRLEDSAGRTLVYQNVSGDKGLRERIAEIKQRAQVLPNDAIYYVIFKNNTRGEDWAYKYCKGNPTQLQQVAPQVMSESTRVYPDYSEKLASKEAEIARLNTQLETLKLQFAYESKLNQLEAQIAQLSEPKESQKPALFGFAEMIIPQALPLFERYLDVREKEAQAKLGQTPAPAPAKKLALPQPGSEAYERLLNDLSELDEDDFYGRIAELASINPDYAKRVYNELTEEESEPTEETPTNEE